MSEKSSKPTGSGVAASGETSGPPHVHVQLPDMLSGSAVRMEGSMFPDADRQRVGVLSS